MAVITINRNFIDTESREHYRLLQHLSAGVSYSTIIDAGTFMGLSAYYLSANSTNEIHTYDISDKHLVEDYLKRPNISFHLKSILDEEPEFINEARIIFLDIDPHDGTQEEIFSKKLLEIGYKGIVVCDDINLNQGMHDWWAMLPGLKLDLTTYGHFSGTGLWMPPKCEEEILLI